MIEKLEQWWETTGLNLSHKDACTDAFKLGISVAVEAQVIEKQRKEAEKDEATRLHFRELATRYEQHVANGGTVFNFEPDYQQSPEFKQMVAAGVAEFRARFEQYKAEQQRLNR
jgi:hypothetical protein